MVAIDRIEVAGWFPGWLKMEGSVPAVDYEKAVTLLLNVLEEADLFAGYVDRFPNVSRKPVQNCLAKPGAG